MGTEIAQIAISDIERMAHAIVKSNLFGVKNADQAIALMLVAQAEGMHPAIVARDYDIVNGRPAKKSEAMLRSFIESGGKVQWHALDDTQADATFSHPAGGSVRIIWDMKRAAAAGLGGKDMWKKYPRQMLRSRTVSEGVRTVCPMATSGMYVPEEVRDFDDRPAPSSSRAAPMIEARPVSKPADDVLNSGLDLQPTVAKEEVPHQIPHQISIPMLEDNSGSDWKAWGTLYADAIKSANNSAEMEEWVRQNAVGMGAIAKESTKLHQRLTEVIAQRRLELSTVLPELDGPASEPATLL